MKIKGTVVSGVMRGEGLIEKHYFRLIGILGFKPWKGTLDIKLEQKIDIRLYATKMIDHLLLDGSRYIDCFLAPVTLLVEKKEYDCWAVRTPDYTHGEDMLEIISKDNLRHKCSLDDNDVVSIILHEDKRKKKKMPGISILKKLYGKQTYLMKQ